MNKKSASNQGTAGKVFFGQSVKVLAEIRAIWETARTYAVKSVNTAHVRANWLIGRQIIEAQQGGKSRAHYGDQLLNFLAENLSREYGTGFSVSSLRYMRLFYKAYPDLLVIHHPAGDESRLAAKRHPPFDQSALLTDWTPGHLHTSLGWRHYRALLKVEKLEARNFYEIEAIRGREIKTSDENPTIGLILCTNKNDTMAEYVLGEKQRRIFASRYQRELPAIEILKQELRRELDQLSPPVSAKPIRKTSRRPK
jgi:hypothetical protein